MPTSNSDNSPEPAFDKLDSNPTEPARNRKSMSLPMAIMSTLTMVIVVRETALLICQALGYASAANIVGMIAMFFILMIWRFTFGIPQWTTQATNTLLVDSGFAFLPVSASAGLLLFALGNEFWGIMITMVVSTLLPLWGLAKLANVWLGNSSSPPTATRTIKENQH